MRSILTLSAVMWLFFGLNAQTNPASSGAKFWTPVTTSEMKLPENTRQILKPEHSKLFHLDLTAMRSRLATAPMEFTAAESPLLLSLPDADGRMRVFQVWESPVMAPQLMAKYPGIRTYTAQATDESGDIMRLGVGYKGFYAFTFSSETGVQTLRPFAEGQDAYYMAYREADLPADGLPGSAVACGTPDGHAAEAPIDFDEEINQYFTADRGGVEPVKLKKYRLAVSAKAEYTVFHGGTKALVMSAIVEAVNFIAALQERDFSVRMELVANNDTLIFFDPNTDPYAGSEVGDWMDANQVTVSNRIGLANYDVGHVFGLYVSGSAGGIAGGRVCNASNKARASSSASSPNGESFYLTIAHELCHQMSGSHTWSICNDLYADQLSSGNAYEPGSGSTIMSYSGACGTNNVQGFSDSYFHVRSMDQVRQFYTTGTGTCGTFEDTDNNYPTATILSPNNVSIPIRTPFELKGEGSDPDGDVLTYCWEQYDLGPSSPLGQPIGNAPLFRSFKPSAVSSRLFPRLTNIILNSTSKTEVLPDTTRPLNFRFSVRDNHAKAGGQAWTAIRLNAVESAGPFLVTYPNTNTVIWYGGEFQTVTWDMANTDKSPVNCQKVNIWLSTDNGATYEFKLADGVPNNGVCCVKVPNIVDNLCRIRIEAVGNVFFDLSNAAFKIRAAEKPGFSLCLPLSQEQVCLPNYSTTLGVGSGLNFTTPVTLEVSGLPVGAVAIFSPNPTVPGTDSKLTVEFPNGQVEGAFPITITGKADTFTVTTNSVLTLVANNFSALLLQTPVDGAASIPQSPTLTWTIVPDANLYEVQVATNPSFEASTIKSAATNVKNGFFNVSTLLDKGQVYYWRVRPLNECGPGPWTEPFVFGTAVEACNTFQANDLPKNILSNSINTVESVITLNAGGAISDVNVKSIGGNHQFFKDIEATLVGPDGTSVALFKDKCGSYSGQFKVGMDDASPTTTFPCPPSQTGVVLKPAAALSVFNGKNAMGEWKLRVKDNVISSGGQLTEFQLEICSSTALSAPFIVNNNSLQLPSGTNASIPTNLLKAEDANNPAAQLTYTLVTVPTQGELQNNFGGKLAAGAQFTQADLDNGAIRYYDYASNLPSDQFRFVVTDGEGGFVSGTFEIQASVGISEPAGDLAFDLVPNPADDVVRLSFGESIRSDVRIAVLNMAGQQLISLNLPVGTLTYLLNVSELPEGMYLVTVQGEQARGARKVVVR